MSKKTELAVVDTNTMQVVPQEETLTTLLAGLQDMDRFPTGRIKIASGGVQAFEVYEPGEDEAEVAREVTGVIVLSHKANAYWDKKFGDSDDKTPVCSSLDGETGMHRETGEVQTCKECPYNQYGTADGGTRRGKACKNVRRLFILRPGDILPMILTIPPTGLAAFDKYRTRLVLMGKGANSVLTKITLKKETNKDGTAFAAPAFEALQQLPPGEVARVAKYAEMFAQSARKVGITEDDYRMDDAQPYNAAVTPTGNMNNAPIVADGFVSVDDDELPFMQPLA